MAAIGQAYDLKRVSPEMIRKRKARTGDVATHGNYGFYHPNASEENGKKIHWILPSVGLRYAKQEDCSLSYCYTSSSSPLPLSLSLYYTPATLSNFNWLI